MGGYTSELIKFKELTTGASDDLRRATNLARRIVTDFGMSDLGPMTFGQKEEYVFLGKELHEARNYSEETAAKIDKQISKILTTANEKAQEILEKHNDKLELIAKTLIREETIGQERFKELMSEDYSPDTKAAPLTPETTKPSDNKTIGNEPSGKASPAPAAA